MPNDELEALQILMLYRMSLGSSVELDIGMGPMMLEGQEQNNGFSFSLPLSIQASPSFGIEFRPAWSNVNGNGLTDYDVTANFGMRHFSINAGYRWFSSENVSLDGPKTGISLSW